jgi:hypothetical protein
MSADSSTLKPQTIEPIVTWRRLKFTLGISALLGLFIRLMMDAPLLVVIARTITMGLVAMIVFGVFERWPKRLPRWLPRSAAQLIAIAVAMPFAALLAYLVTTGGDPDFSQNRGRIMGFGILTFSGVLFAPWIAVGAMLKQRDAFAREQALSFELERTQLARNALDARLRLLQAQVEPHFLFNTLANVQALVDSGSPQASKVLSSLIAYLRASVPRMHDRITTLDHELQLVRAYLELMQMRIPDRLQFALRIDPAARELQCPPMTLLTLVENAVRHGIDPSEEGGRIDIDVMLRGRRCFVRVSDTGMGLQITGQRRSDGLGTGLSTLRERLQLTFGNDAQLRLLEVQPHGVCAEIDFPAQRHTA